MPAKRLYRSEHNRVLAGVCGGLADYFDIDPIIVRLIFIVIGIMGVGTGVILYLIGMLIIPKETELEYGEINNRRSSNISTSNQVLLYVGIVIILMGIFISINKFDIVVFPDYLHIVKFYFKKLFWPGLLIILGFYLILEHKKQVEQKEDMMDYTTINNSSQYSDSFSTKEENFANSTDSKDQKSYSTNRGNLDSKKLYRSLTNKKLTGLCGGIAEYFDVDATLVRLLVVIIILSSGVFLGLITYFVVSLIIPTAPPKINSHVSSSQEQPAQKQDNE